MMEITLTNKTKARVSRRWLLGRIKQLIKFLKIKSPIQLSVAIVSGRAMRRWNRIYRGKNKTTDILSFDYRAPRSSGLDGEILLAREEAPIIARERKTSLNRAFLWLIIHGILHLEGYEHENVSLKKAKRMFIVQDQLARHFHV